MKRYGIVVEDYHEQVFGEWVKYDDAIKEISALQEYITHLQDNHRDAINLLHVIRTKNAKLKQDNFELRKFIHRNIKRLPSSEYNKATQLVNG